MHHSIGNSYLAVLASAKPSRIGKQTQAQRWVGFLLVVKLLTREEAGLIPASYRHPG
jgi:hypothetical protein